MRLRGCKSLVIIQIRNYYDGRAKLVWFELLIGCSERPSSWSVPSLHGSHFDCQSRTWDWRRGRSYRNRSFAVSK